MNTLSRYGHIPQNEGPGSLWVPPHDAAIRFKEHTCAPGELLSRAHYDVFVKYGYAHAMLAGDSEKRAWWGALYDTMQERRIGRETRTRFDALIAYAKAHGMETFPAIPVDPHYDILDGSHRAALALALGSFPRVVSYGTPSHAYGREWFSESGFSASELGKIDAVRDTLYANHVRVMPTDRIGIVWGVALPYWEVALATLAPNNVQRAFLVDLGSREAKKRFITETYLGDGMSNENIEKKAERLSAATSLIGVVTMRDTAERVVAAKKKVRERIAELMPSYFFDCAFHAIDNEVQAHILFNRYAIDK